MFTRTSVHFFWGFRAKWQIVHDGIKNSLAKRISQVPVHVWKFLSQSSRRISSQGAGSVQLGSTYNDPSLAMLLR